MADADDAREARRQRILKSRAERLAFITGDRKSLDPVALKVRRSDQEAPAEIEPDRVPGQEISAEREQGIRERIGGQEERIHREEEERIKQHIKALSEDKQILAPQGPAISSKRQSILTLEAFQASLDASRGFRALLSLLVALQVVLLSSLGSTFIFGGHPMLLVFITSASIVLLFMLLGYGSQAKTTTTTAAAAAYEPSGLDRILRLLKALLAARSAANAIALDLCIFAVAIVCLLPIAARYFVLRERI